MSTALNGTRTNANQPYVSRPLAKTESWRGRTPDRRHDTLASEKEASAVIRYVFGLALLGVLPLIVFLFLHYFMPELLLSLTVQTGSGR